MWATIFLKIEIIIFLISFSYVVYYILDKLKNTYFKVQEIIQPKREIKEKNKAKIVATSNTWKRSWTQKSRKALTWEERIKLNDLLKRIKLNTAKWYLDTSKALIIEWLTIDKFNKELNLELADIYEQEKNYKNAEFIYKDLLSNLWKKFFILEKLAKVLLLQWQIKESIKYYKRALKRKPNEINTIEALSDLTFDLKDYTNCLVYTKVYLKDNPRSSDKLAMKWFCLEKLWNKEEAIIEYKKALEMKPYNNEIIERIKKLKK